MSASGPSSRGWPGRFPVHWDFSAFIADFAGSDRSRGERQATRRLPARGPRVHHTDNSTEALRAQAMADNRTIIIDDVRHRPWFPAAGLGRRQIGNAATPPPGRRGPTTPARSAWPSCAMDRSSSCWSQAVPQSARTACGSARGTATSTWSGRSSARCAESMRAARSWTWCTTVRWSPRTLLRGRSRRAGRLDRHADSWRARRGRRHGLAGFGGAAGGKPARAHSSDQGATRSAIRALSSKSSIHPGYVYLRDTPCVSLALNRPIESGDSVLSIEQRGIDLISPAERHVSLARALWGCGWAPT